LLHGKICLSARCQIHTDSRSIDLDFSFREVRSNVGSAILAHC